MDLKLPALPTALAEIIKIQRAPAPDIKRLVSIIENDPAIALYVLRQINSAYYGLRKQVNQINRAVTLLGSKKVCNMVLAATLKHTFASIKGPTARSVYQHILKTSIATAVFSRDLAEHLRLSSSEMAFTAGLFHQLGRLVFLYNASDRYLPLWYKRDPEQQRVVLGSPTLSEERTIFKTDYLQLGVVALNRWGLPEELAAIISRLRTLDKVTESPIQILPLLVAIGRSVSENLFEPPGYGSYVEHEQNGRPVLLSTLAASRNITPDSLDTFFEEKSEVVEQYAQAMVHMS